MFLDGQIHDTDRSDFLHRYLLALRRGCDRADVHSFSTGRRPTILSGTAAMPSANESEITVCLIQYLRSSENRSARLQTTGAAQMRYEIVRWKDGVERLCETVFFDSLGAFLYVDFFHGLNRNYLPRKCENCHRWFLLAAGKYSSCCNRPLKNEPGKTCRDVGSRKRYDDKCKNDPIWLAYNRAYKTHYARYLKKKMTTAQFEQWSRYAVELRQKAETGEMELVDYQRELRV